MGPQKRLMKDQTAEGGREREEQRKRGTGEQAIFGDLQVLITRDIPQFVQHWRPTPYVYSREEFPWKFSIWKYNAGRQADSKFST